MPPLLFVHVVRWQVQQVRMRHIKGKASTKLYHKTFTNEQQHLGKSLTETVELCLLLSIVLGLIAGRGLTEFFVRQSRMIPITLFFIQAT